MLNCKVRDAHPTGLPASIAFRCKGVVSRSSSRRNAVSSADFHALAAFCFHPLAAGGGSGQAKQGKLVGGSRAIGLR